MYLFRCRDEHLNREASLQNPETLPRLLGFAMFEAELFCNYRVSTQISFRLYLVHRLVHHDANSFNLCTLIYDCSFAALR